MKSTLVVYFTLLFVAFSFAALSDVAYLTYWSDHECQNFAGAKAITNNTVTLTGTWGNKGVSCRESMRCLLNPHSDGCSLIATTFSNNTVTVKGNTVYSNGANYTKHDCTQSSLYEGCYFRFIPDSEYDKLFNYFANSASTLLPVGLLALVLVFL